MSSSPNSSIVNHTIDLNYANKKRSKSLKWIFLNSILFVVFVYDLSCKCPGYTSAFHYVELLCVAVFTANLVQYALWLVPSRKQPVYLSREQQKLLGLSDADLDSSFIISKGNETKPRVGYSSEEEWSVSEAEMSLSPRGWRHTQSDSPPSPRSPPSPHSPPSPYSSPSPYSKPASSSPISRLDNSQDCFIADRESLTAYLKQMSEAEEAAVAAAAAEAAVPAPDPLLAHAYRLAPLLDGTSKSSEESPQSSPELWWRLDIDPQRVTQWNLNLRLWLHATIVSRVSRELETMDAALARAGVALAGELVAGRVPLSRLAGTVAAPLVPFLSAAVGARAASLPYVVSRIRELAATPCLSGYRWDGGGAGYSAAYPTDAELLLALLAAYVDAHLPPGARPFGVRHLAADSAAAASADPGEPVIVRVGGRPPAWALALGGARLAPARGRDNLLHVLLLFLAAAARRRPPAIDRLHLGPAGLNMLWIIGR